MKQVVILKAGSKIDTLADVAGDYEDWIAEGMALPADALKVVAVVEEGALPDIDTVAAIVITGSDAMVTDATEWMEEGARWLREALAHGIPVLGICFGHQLLAHALGGKVDNNPRGIEVGTVTVETTAAAASDPLLQGMPSSFPAQLSHTQSVLELPPEAQLLACSEMEPHQAFVWKNRAWGIQFHPEFDERVIPCFIDYYRNQLEEQGRPVELLMRDVRPTPKSRSLLQRFAALVLQ